MAPPETGEFPVGGLGPEVAGLDALTDGFHRRERADAFPLTDRLGLDSNSVRSRPVLLGLQPVERAVGGGPNPADRLQEAAFHPAFPRRWSGGVGPGDPLASFRLGLLPLRGGEGGVGHAEGVAREGVER